MDRADFTYKITPGTISIIDSGRGKLSVANYIEAVLRKIEYWHQGSIFGLKIMCGLTWPISRARRGAS